MPLRMMVSPLSSKRAIDAPIVSAIAVLPIDPPALVATGPNGSDISRNGAEIWVPWPELAGHNAIAFAPDGSAGWAVGSEGRITRIELP